MPPRETKKLLYDGQLAALAIAEFTAGKTLDDYRTERMLRSLEYAENTGAFLGFVAEWPLPGRMAIFGVGTGLALVIMAVMVRRLQPPRSALLDVTLFVAGGASNLLDRSRLGESSTS